MKISLRSLILLMGLAVPAATLLAQAPVRSDPAAPQGPRVGVVDRQELDRAAAAVGADSADAYRKRRMTELSGIQDAIRVLQKRIVDEGASLSPDAREEILSDIRRRQEELRLADQKTKEELKARADHGSGMVAEHIGKVASKRGLDIVLDRADPAVLWINPAVDLTSEVVASIRQAAATK